MVFEQKRTISQLQHDLDKKTHALNELMAGQSSQHDSQMRELIARNKHLLEEQNRLLKKVPESLRVNSESLSRAKEVETRIRAEFDERLKSTVHAIQQAKESEIDLIKQQVSGPVLSRYLSIDNLSLL